MVDGYACLFRLRSRSKVRDAMAMAINRSLLGVLVSVLSVSGNLGMRGERRDRRCTMCPFRLVSDEVG